MNQMEKLKNYRRALKRVFSSPDGEVVEAMLREVYVDAPALVASSEVLTYYRLGQKELIQALLKDSKEDLEFHNNQTEH